MSSLVLGTVTYAPAENAPGLTSGRFWLAVSAGERQEGVTEYEFPGIDGFGVKWLGFRGRTVQVRAMYKGASRSAVLALVEADISALSGSLWTATLPDYPNALEHCRLLSAAPGRVTPNASGGYIVVVGVAFRQEYE